MSFRFLRHCIIVVFTLSLAGCARGCAGKLEIAFCEAVDRKDAAAARALFDGGHLNMLARNASGQCQPIQSLFTAATPRSPEFTAMAVAFAARDGVANTCWTRPAGGGVASGSSGGAQVCPIQMAARNGSAPVMRALIDAGVNLKDHVASQALVDAAAARSLEIVGMLVEAGASPDAAFLTAIRARNSEMVTYLESKGARENVDPVLVAARRGDIKGIEAAIAQRANLDAVDGGGVTAVMRAAANGYPEVITRLAKAGAKLELTVDGETALHMAARENQAASIRALVAAGAQVDAHTDIQEMTPLVVAVRQSAIDAVNALVDARANVNVWSESDTTILGDAIAQGRLDLVRAILRGGARLNEPHGVAWKPALHSSLGRCGIEPGPSGESDYYGVALLRTLVAAGADRTARNKEGQTAIEFLRRELSAAQDDFRRTCMKAKLDYLESIK
jgi:ankyrin repeat protein